MLTYKERENLLLIASSAVEGKTVCIQCTVSLKMLYKKIQQNVIETDRANKRKKKIEELNQKYSCQHFLPFIILSRKD